LLAKNAPTVRGFFSDVINDGDVIDGRVDWDGGQQSRSVRLIEDD